MTHYLHNGNRYTVAPHGALDVSEFLPLGTYKVGYIEPIDDFYLEHINDFQVEGKVYGKALAQRDRILRTFQERSGGTGVMLSGEKGSGKTLLAKLLSLQAQETGIPTIVINQPWHGDTFNAFVQSIEQPAVIVFDEFEKVYETAQQEKLLTLLDGTYASKKLFVLTCNDRYRVNTHMRNRPGRIYYRIDFGGLESDFIRSYCQDNLYDNSHVESVVRVAMLFARFNFDILKALIEEMNRYGEDAETALEMLNAKPELGDDLTYRVSLIDRGKPVPVERMHNRSEWRGNPLTDRVQIYYRSADESDTDSFGDFTDVSFVPTDLKRIDVETGDFHFVNPDGMEASLREIVTKQHDYSVVY